MLKEQYDLPPVMMALLKNIPAGAGPGGGSADAEFALKALNEKFELELSENDLLSIAGKPGSDCPFFLENKPMLATGNR